MLFRDDGDPVSDGAALACGGMISGALEEPLPQFQGSASTLARGLSAMLVYNMQLGIRRMEWVRAGEHRLAQPLWFGISASGALFGMVPPALPFRVGPWQPQLLMGPKDGGVQEWQRAWASRSDEKVFHRKVARIIGKRRHACAP